VAKELDYALKGNSPQIRRDGDDANVNSSGRGSKCLGVATEHDPCPKYLRYRCVHRVELFKVKVQNFFFFRAQGFPARRDRHSVCFAIFKLCKVGRSNM
jgi:hypothetical protein